jgi:hypothetical protein
MYISLLSLRQLWGLKIFILSNSARTNGKFLKIPALKNFAHKRPSRQE